MKKKIGLFLFIICMNTICIAQLSVSTAGGEATGSGGTVSYTIGQVSYSNYTGNEGTVSQGVQQPYEIQLISSSEDKYGINLELSIYPNPVNEYLKLKVKNYTTGNLMYQLYDMNGKLLENKKLEANETNIQTEKLVRAVYILKVTDNDKEVKTFKIIKY
jgi:hypothetical protein